MSSEFGFEVAIIDYGDEASAELELTCPQCGASHVGRT